MQPQHSPMLAPPVAGLRRRCQLKAGPLNERVRPCFSRPFPRSSRPGTVPDSNASLSTYNSCRVVLPSGSILIPCRIDLCGRGIVGRGQNAGINSLTRVCHRLYISMQQFYSAMKSDVDTSVGELREGSRVEVHHCGTSLPAFGWHASQRAQPIAFGERGIVVHVMELAEHCPQYAAGGPN